MKNFKLTLSQDKMEMLQNITFTISESLGGSYDYDDCWEIKLIGYCREVIQAIDDVLPEGRKFDYSREELTEENKLPELTIVITDIKQFMRILSGYMNFDIDWVSTVHTAYNLCRELWLELYDKLPEKDRPQEWEYENIKMTYDERLESDRKLKEKFNKEWNGNCSCPF